MANSTNGSLAAAAISFLCDCEKTIPLSRGGKTELRAQFNNLAVWAKSCYRLIDYQPPLGADTSSGTEHVVYVHEADGRVYKKTKDGLFGSIRTEQGTRRTATPYFYLRRLEWTNDVFDSDLRLEYIVPGPPSAIVISQPFWEAKDPDNASPSVDEIVTFMTQLGFESVHKNPQEWYRKSDYCSACDAKAENFINGHEGIIPIDLIVSKDLGFDPHSI